MIANRWKCCINKAVRLETVHLFRWLYLKSLQNDQFTDHFPPSFSTEVENPEQIFSSLKVLFAWNTIGQAMCGVPMYWVALEALLAVVCPPGTCVVACV